MAHINRSRDVLLESRRSILSFLRPEDAPVSFGAFGGSSFQRNSVALHQIARCCGRKGVVLVHNDPSIESHLLQLYTLYPVLNTTFPSSRIYLANSRGACYDPLYGLRESDVLDALVPDNDAFHHREVQELRSVLSDYLGILSEQYRRAPQVFGSSPYSLDLLLELVQMPYAALERSVLRYLPPALSARLIPRLSAANAQQQAYNTVLDFSQKMSRCLWQRRPPTQHPRLSIVQSVAGRDLISIYVPNSRSDILDYLAVELRSLNDRLQPTPYLLLSCGIDLKKSKSFREFFLTEHTAQRYSTGILAEDISGVLDSDTEGHAMAALFSQTEDLFVFQCSSGNAAAPFCESIGTYFREVVDHHQETHRPAFHVFADHGYGTALHESEELRVKPAELTSLGGGCLVIRKSDLAPCLVRQMDLDSVVQTNTLIPRR